MKAKRKKKTTNQVSELYAIERDASWENFPFLLFYVLCSKLPVSVVCYTNWFRQKRLRLHWINGMIFQLICRTINLRYLKYIQRRNTWRANTNCKSHCHTRCFRRWTHPDFDWCEVFVLFSYHFVGLCFIFCVGCCVQSFHITNGSSIIYIYWKWVGLL